MSASLARDFLPGVESFLGHTLWTFIFPAHVEQLCPRPQLPLQVSQERTMTLMWPAASICCLLGIVIGFSYGTALLCKALSSKAEKGTFTWGFAFLWYGLMSTGGLFYHCIHKTRVFYLLDLVSTACTCVSILAIYRIFGNSDDRSTSFRTSMIVGYVILVCLALFGGATLRNILYLVPASLAFLVGVYFAVNARKGTRGRPAVACWLACASVNALIGIFSLPLDPWLCATFGANFSMLFWYFLGCDLAMVCLFHFTRQANNATHGLPKCKPS